MTCPVLAPSLQNMDRIRISRRGLHGTRDVGRRGVVLFTFCKALKGWTQCCVPWHVHLMMYLVYFSLRDSLSVWLKLPSLWKALHLEMGVHHFTHGTHQSHKLQFSEGLKCQQEFHHPYSHHYRIIAPQRPTTTTTISMITTTSSIITSIIIIMIIIMIIFSNPLFLPCFRSDFITPWLSVAGQLQPRKVVTWRVAKT